MSNCKTPKKEFNLEDFRALQASLKNPAFRIPVDMNINAFKRMLDSSELILTKGERNRLIRQYKEKAWGEYDEIVKGVGSFPTRTVVESTSNGEQARK